MRAETGVRTADRRQETGDRSQETGVRSMQVNVLFKIPASLEASGVLRRLNSEFWFLTPVS